MQPIPRICSISARRACARTLLSSGESTGQVLIEFADDRPADNQAGCGRAEEMLYAPLRNDGAGRVQVSASRRKHKQTNKQPRPELHTAPRGPTDGTR